MQTNLFPGPRFSSIVAILIALASIVSASGNSLQDSIRTVPSEEVTTDTMATQEDEDSTEGLPQEEPVPAPDGEIPEVSTDSLEKAYFAFLTALNDEQPRKTGRLLGRLGLSSSNFGEYKLAEYSSYLDIFFPEANSDQVQSFIIQSYIDQKKWEEFEISLLKFLYLHPDSPLRAPVIGMGSQVVQKEGYFEPRRDEFLAGLSSVTGTGEINERYFQFILGLKSEDHTSSSPIFKREAIEFLKLYPSAKEASTALLWLSQFESSNDAHQEAYMNYRKLAAVYPASEHLAEALFRTGTLQQEEFGEFKEAIATFRILLSQFPGNPAAPDARFRIASIIDGQLKEFNSAVQEYETLVSHYPDSPKAIPSLFRIGELQAEKLKQTTQAIAAYERIASDYPDSADSAIEALQRSAKLYEKEKEFEKAVAQHLTVCERYPGTPGCLSSLEASATLYEKKLKMNDKAVEVLNRIIEEFPDSKHAEKAAKRLKKLQK